jgi:hypothetical protein
MVTLNPPYRLEACTNPLRYPCGCQAWDEWVRTERVGVWQHREWHCQKHQGTGP